MILIFFLKRNIYSLPSWTPHIAIKELSDLEQFWKNTSSPSLCLAISLLDKGVAYLIGELCENLMFFSVRFLYWMRWLMLNSLSMNGPAFVYHSFSLGMVCPQMEYAFLQQLFCVHMIATCQGCLPFSSFLHLRLGRSNPNEMKPYNVLQIQYFQNNLDPGLGSSFISLGCL